MAIDERGRFTGKFVGADDTAQIGSTEHPVTALVVKDVTQTGNSTIAGTLAVTGAANFAGATTVTSSLRVDGGLTTTVGAVGGLSSQVSQLIYSSFKTGGTPWFQPDGTNTKDIMDSFTLPANVLTTGRTLKFKVYGVHTGANTNVCTVAITVGGTIAAYQTTLATGTDIASFSADVSGVPFCLTADMYQLEASVQRCYARFNEGFTADILPTDTSLTQDMTTSKSFILTLKNVTAATDASIYGWTVELV
jgi:hypothetical protein